MNANELKVGDCLITVDGTNTRYHVERFNPSGSVVLRSRSGTWTLSPAAIAERFAPEKMTKK